MLFAAAIGSLALVSTVAGQAKKGFNYGSTFTDSAPKQQSDFEDEFITAQKLGGTSGFTSARLYTMIQAGTTNDPISAIPAALGTKTSLLLGLWASVDQSGFDNELTALKKAIDQYGDAFVAIVDGISVGSEDLYRISPTGIAAKSGYGANPDVIANYIGQTKKAIAGTTLGKAKIGHVDTWTAWVNGSNQAVIDACEWIGVDAYPYFQDTMANDINNNAKLFDDAVKASQAAVGNKEIWITETGFPVSGKTANLAIPSTENAKTYWDQVGCGMLFGKTNTWWYTLQDAAPDTPSPSFGIIGKDLNSKPLFDLSCLDAPSLNTSSTSSASSPSNTGSDSSSGSGSGSGTSGGPGSNATVTTGSPSASSTTHATSAATGTHSFAFVAAFLAIMVAVFAL